MVCQNTLLACQKIGMQFMPEILLRLHFRLFHLRAVDFHDSTYCTCKEDSALFFSHALYDSLFA